MAAYHCFVLQVATSTWSYSLKLKYQLQLRASSWVGTSSSRSNLKYKTPFGQPEQQFWASARSWISLPASCGDITCARSQTLDKKLWIPEIVVFYETIQSFKIQDFLIVSLGTRLCADVAWLREKSLIFPYFLTPFCQCAKNQSLQKYY